jgi:hypothetical protein
VVALCVFIVAVVLFMGFDYVGGKIGALTDVIRVHGQKQEVWKRVRVVRSTDAKDWYNDKIGRVFDAKAVFVFDERECYLVNADGQDRYIYDFDCEVVSE